MNSSLEIIPSALACIALASKCMLPVANSGVACACVPLANNSAAAARVNGCLNMASPLAWAWRCRSGVEANSFRRQYAPSSQRMAAVTGRARGAPRARECDRLADPHALQLRLLEVG